jgi:hypothetical protein
LYKNKNKNRRGITEEERKRRELKRRELKRKGQNCRTEEEEGRKMETLNHSSSRVTWGVSTLKTISVLLFF